MFYLFYFKLWVKGSGCSNKSPFVRATRGGVACSSRARCLDLSHGCFANVERAAHVPCVSTWLGVGQTIV